ncbi:heat-inducible transcriptional repressor [Bacilli bacterium PM5-3]|nr:heat-inducible transcriptional repressor [Bacilli bacterium PM5-3]MDH6603254.1 heat-inducible transcriptional repressor [Bacilli bacterium PM5-9]
MLTPRQINILKVIINDFISDAIPVGSKTLKINHELPYSSATIRNEMATLEDLGLLEKTHTSSGRIPSNQGYRYYVDYLMDEHDIDEDLKEKLESLFNDKKLEIEEIVKETCDLIAKMTNYTSIALGAESREEILTKIEVIPMSDTSIVVIIVTNTGKVESKIFNINKDINLNELQKCVKVLNKMLVGTKLSEVVLKIDNEIKEELAKHVANYEYLLDAFVNAFIKFASDYVYVGGRANIINQPDFNDINKIRSLVSVMEDHDFFETLAKNIDGTSVMIGDENQKFSIDDVTIVTSNYNVSDEEKGVIAIIGPTRMDYDKVINLLDYASDKISQLIKEKRGEDSE